MVLVFIILGSLIITFIFFITLIFSAIKVEIKNLKIGNKENGTRIKDNYEIKISICLLGKLPIFKIKFNNKKMSKIYNSDKIRKIDFNSFRKNKISKEQVLNLLDEIKLQELQLQVDIRNRKFNIYIFYCSNYGSYFGYDITTLGWWKNKYLQIYYNTNFQK